MLLNDFTPWILYAMSIQMTSAFGIGASSPYSSQISQPETGDQIPLFIPYPFKNVHPYPNSLNSFYHLRHTTVRYPRPVYSRYDWPTTTEEEEEEEENDGDNTDSSTTEDSEASTADEPGLDLWNSFIATLEAFFIVKPAVSAVISLMNIVSIIMLALGAEVKMVGRRSIPDFESSSSNHMSSLSMNQLIIEGLKLGSNDTSHLCVQRAACEVPTRALLFTKALDYMSQMPDISWISMFLDDLNSMADGLRQGASYGSQGYECDEIFQCDELKVSSFYS